MMSHTAAIRAIRTIAQDTLAFRCTRPPGYVFRAGQYAPVSLPGIDDGIRREFSFASAPHEDDIEIAMRIRESAFKNAMARSSPGDTLLIGESRGESAELPAALPRLWLAGGIGVAPFRSIILDMMHAGAATDVVLIHSARSHDDAPYAAELEAASGANPGFVYRLWQTGTEHEHIRAEDIRTIVPDLMARHIAIVGTRPFVASMRAALPEELAEDRIQTERFCGYTRAALPDNPSTHDTTSSRQDSEHVPAARRF